VGVSPAAADPPDRSAERVLRHRRRVLIVDDNHDFAVSLGTVLRFNGHDVELAFDGSSALALARQYRPEIAFLDLGLPGINGFDLARELRADPTTRQAVLIALTGWGQDKDRERTRTAGFDAHVVKPVDPAVIAQMVDALGERGGRMAEPTAP
jgi:DNA-binding response OmpR family regulator